MILATPTLTHTLSASVNPPQAGSVSPSGGEYGLDEQVTLTASATSGYVFDHWSGNASGTSPTITLTMDSDISLTANFKPVTTVKHNLTISINGQGTINPSVGTYEYSNGAQVAINVSSISGWDFDHWSGNATGTSPTITLTMDSDKSLTANFELIITEKHNLTISINGQGTINPSVGTYEYSSGAQVTINVSSISGWDFDHWSGDATGTSPIIVITMDSDKHVTAYFEDQSFITGGGSGGGCGCS